MTGNAWSFAKALLTTKRVQIINYKKFAVVALDLSKKVFVVYPSGLILSSI